MSAFTGLPGQQRSGTGVDSLHPPSAGSASRGLDPSLALIDLSNRLARPALVSVDLPAPLLPSGLCDNAEALRRNARVIWERPEKDLLLAGFGEAVSIRGDRSSPLAEAASAIRLALAGAVSNVDSPAVPRCFLGGRFVAAGRVRNPEWDDMGGWHAVVPRVLVAIHDGRVSASLTVHAFPGARTPEVHTLVDEAFAGISQTRLPGGGAALAPGCVAESETWDAGVRQVLAEIAKGQYAKAVLARSELIHAVRPIDTGTVLSDLAARYRHCFVFAFRTSGQVWLGASPELLASRNGPVVHAASLAGSRPRGVDLASDRLLEAELRESPKERAEHAVVAEAIREALTPLCSSITAPAEPEVLRMPNIQHLHTPVTGQLSPGADLLDVITRLHPTPAVGGWPSQPAVDAIDRIENMDRGWYAGPVGWLDFNGDGEFAVGLRAALITGHTARLYAGAGIVVGSEPGLEYAETEAKLRPLREAIGVATGVD